MTNTLARPLDMLSAGKAADNAARKTVFARYKEDKALNTERRHRAALRIFADFLADVGIVDAPSGDALYDNSSAWRGVTYGLVEAYARWLFERGYNVRTVNMHLCSLRIFSRLAAQAGDLDQATASAINGIRGYRFAQAQRIDAKRDVTRVSTEKTRANFLTPAQVRRLKRQPCTPQGLRDALLICLLVDHGLRVSEAAALKLEDIDIDNGLMVFYRTKTARTDTHRLTKDTWSALLAYLRCDKRVSGPVLRATSSSGRLVGTGMSTSGIARRVRYLGSVMLGIPNLGPHDLRHSFAELARRGGTPDNVLQAAGGWDGADMVGRYTARAKIANEGVTFFAGDA